MQATTVNRSIALGTRSERAWHFVALGQEKLLVPVRALADSESMKLSGSFRLARVMDGQDLSRPTLGHSFSA